MEAAAWFFVWGLAPTFVASFASSSSTFTSKKRGTSPSSSVSSVNTIRMEATKRTVFGVDRAVDIPGDVFPSESELASMEKAMPPCEHGWFESCYKGAQLHYRKWLPDTKPKAVVIFMHGIQTHSGKSSVLKDGRKINVGLQAETLLKDGMALFAYDLYGHGLSEGTRFWIPDSWENNKEDCLRFVQLVQQQLDESTPVFLLGESYGCTLALHVAKHFQDHPDQAPKNFDSIILTAPAIIGDLPPWPVLKLLVFLAGRYPKWRPFFMPNPVSADRIWRDPEVLAKRTDPKYLATQIDGSGIPFRLGTGVNLIRALETVRKNVIPELTTPFLILHGTKDFAVPIEGSDFLWEHAATPAAQRKFLRKEGAFHDLFSDYVAEECMQDVLDWIHQRLEARTRA